MKGELLKTCRESRQGGEAFVSPGHQAASDETLSQLQLHPALSIPPYLRDRCVPRMQLVFAK